MSTAFSKLGQVRSDSVEATARLAARIAPLLEKGDCILLTGDLGAGKTAFARALIHALIAQKPEVASPTYTLLQTYDAPGNAVADLRVDLAIGALCFTTIIVLTWRYIHRTT